MKNLTEAELWLERANDTLFASDFNLKNELTLAAVNRAYYSMFYCTTALLRMENVISKFHSGTLIKFGELFIKTNKIPKLYASMLKKSFEYRQSSDYDIEVNISDQETQILVNYAKEFYELTKSYIEKLND